jgi:hypothetical protein
MPSPVTLSEHARREAARRRIDDAIVRTVAETIVTVYRTSKIEKYWRTR